MTDMPGEPLDVVAAVIGDREVGHGFITEYTLDVGLKTKKERKKGRKEETDKVNGICPLDWTLNGFQFAKSPPARDKDAGIREPTPEDKVSIHLSSMDQTRGSGGIITLETHIFPLAADPAGLTRHLKHYWRT